MRRQCDYIHTTSGPKLHISKSIFLFRTGIIVNFTQNWETSVSKVSVSFINLQTVETNTGHTWEPNLSGAAVTEVTFFCIGTGYLD